MRRVSRDLVAHGLLRVRERRRSAVHLRHHLVRDDDRDVELKFRMNGSNRIGNHLISEALQDAQEVREVHLTRGELLGPQEVRSVEGHRAVDDDERIARFGHHLRGVVQQLRLVVGVVAARVRHLVEHALRTEVEPEQE